MYKLVLDRMVGGHKLHKNVGIVAAGNLETDNAIVQTMSTALQSRMVHMELVVDAKEWVNWASEAQLDHRITSYINFKPNAIYTFKPDHSDHTYACPRTWTFANKVLKENAIGDSDLLPMLAGTISEGVAREFMGFCKIHSTLPSIQEIIKNPTGLSISDEPSVLYALTGALAQNVQEESMEHLMKYILRMPLEFQVVCLREILRRNKTMMGHKSLQSWVASNAAELF